MELLRVDNNAWGQEILLGISWDLLWFFVGGALAFIVIHIVYSRFWSVSKKPKTTAQDGVQTGVESRAS